MLGDCFLSAYKARGDAEWINFHNALCRALATFAAQAGVSARLEGGKIRGTKKRPGDVRFAGDSGAHGWTAAGSRELWVDVTVVGPLCTTYIAAAATTRGAAAAAAAAHKRTKYRNGIPGLAHFVPLAFETEGFVSADTLLLLANLAKKKVDKYNLPEAEVKDQVKRWMQHWTDELAVVHARYLARAIYFRAAACREASNPSYRRASTVDVDLASHLPPPALLPCTASAAGAAAAAAA